MDFTSRLGLRGSNGSARFAKQGATSYSPEFLESGLYEGDDSDRQTDVKSPHSSYSDSYNSIRSSQLLKQAKSFEGNALNSKLGQQQLHQQPLMRDGTNQNKLQRRSLGKEPLGLHHRIQSSDDSEQDLDDSQEFGAYTNDERSLKRRMDASKRRFSNSSATSNCFLPRSNCLRFALAALVAFLLINLIVYLMPAPTVRFKTTPLKPRPAFTGTLAVNGKLDEAERLFEGQLNAPESMAWRSDKRSFYTGVEGGFIVWIEPAEERWTVVARLNARNAIRDKSHLIKFEGVGDSKDSPNSAPETATDEPESHFVPFCTRDVEVYGKRAEFEPRPVIMSRCSRPLGIRLAPNDTHLYVSDPLSGLYKVELKSTTSVSENQVTKLIDFSQFQAQDGFAPVTSDLENYRDERIGFADDIAVNWGGAPDGADLIYLTDCSKRWPLRYLLWLMLENDDTGRVLVFDTGKQTIRQLEQQYSNVDSNTQESRGDNYSPWPEQRNLSFPNGLELTANKSALLISDLNNRRILMHHLAGPLKGRTNQLLWAPGYTDNIKRGRDALDGRPTYWAACGCAVDDGKFELAEFFNGKHSMKRLLLKWLNSIGWLTNALGSMLGSTSIQDFGLMLQAGWLKTDPYCRHGLVFQFDEAGQILRSLHAPSGFSSYQRLLSEASEVLSPNSSSTGSHLYLGSVYYSYLGRLELEDRV